MKIIHAIPVLFGIKNKSDVFDFTTPKVRLGYENTVAPLLVQRNNINKEIGYTLKIECI
ncbi:hypothetical protein ACL9RF_01455 [Sphingobacterium sp. Mn56C]|uniref:hypothetical protein n=1 Tax=Sphingobacterium sp. Mn56C TaxID=3395261 RepID=UPI003BD8F8D4